MARTGHVAETIWRSKRSKVFGKWYALRTLRGYIIAERVKPLDKGPSGCGASSKHPIRPFSARWAKGGGCLLKEVTGVWMIHAWKAARTGLPDALTPNSRPRSIGRRVGVVVELRELRSAASGHLARDPLP